MSLQPVLPFSGRSPASRQASYCGALAGSWRVGAKTAAYLALLAERGPLTDLAAAEALSWQRSSVNSVRNILVASNLVAELAEPPYIEPRTGVRNIRWTLTDAGRRVAA